MNTLELTLTYNMIPWTSRNNWTYLNHSFDRVSCLILVRVRAHKNSVQWIVTYSIKQQQIQRTKHAFTDFKQTRNIKNKWNRTHILLKVEQVSLIQLRMHLSILIGHLWIPLLSFKWSYVFCYFSYMRYRRMY